MLEVLHGVVDRQARGHDAARRVDVQEAVALGVLGLEEEQLSDEQVRHRVLDGVPDEDDPFLEQAREDVVGALAARGLLDDHRDVARRGHGRRLIRTEGTPRLMVSALEECTAAHRSRCSIFITRIGSRSGSGAKASLRPWGIWSTVVPVRWPTKKAI